MGYADSLVEHFHLRVRQAIEYPPKKGSKVEIRDEDTKGLIVRVSSSGHAAYYVYIYDPLTKKSRYEKVSDYTDIPLDKARRLVTERRERVAHMTAVGESYVQVKEGQKEKRRVEAKRSEMTLRACLSHYVEHSSNLSTAGRRDYEKLVYTPLNSGDILDQPVSEITRTWFEERFRTIYARTKATAWRWRRVMHAVLSNAQEREPTLFQSGFPVPPQKKLAMSFEKPGRKTKRLSPTSFPAARAQLLELDDDYTTHYFMILLLTGMRSGAAMRLRYDMTCDRKDSQAWAEGRILVYEATEDRDPVELVISKQVQGIILARKRLYGSKSPWLFWSRRKPENFEKHCGDDRDIFNRVGLLDNEGTKLSAHDLRRTFSHTARSVLSIDPFLTAMLMLHSTKNMSVPDGYVAPTPADLRRATNRISDKIIEWTKSTEGEIRRELAGDAEVIEKIEEFSL